jgi:hypothetical protein
MTRPPGSHPPTALAEAAGFLAIAAVLCCLGALWLWGGLTGLLFGAGWPRGLTLADHVRVALRLPTSQTQPPRGPSPPASTSQGRRPSTPCSPR